MNYIKHMPKEISFSQEGFNGYSYNIESENISIDFEDSFKGHDKYTMNKKSESIYYIVEGNGIFKIENEIFKVEKGDIVQIPANTIFVYKGKMKLLLIMNPPFDVQNDISLKENDLY